LLVKLSGPNPTLFFKVTAIGFLRQSFQGYRPDRSIGYGMNISIQDCS
jgi:hypothetical protein